MSRSPLRVLVCGRLDEAESQLVESALGELPSNADIRRQTAGREDWPRSAAASDLCVVLQAWPDEFPAAEIQALLSACIAGRLVCCQGAWCASAARTRSGSWPLAVCTAVEQFAWRLAFEVDVLYGRRVPLPSTAARDEIFAALYSAAASPADLGAIAVVSPDRTYAETLSSRIPGHSPALGALPVLFDVDPPVAATTSRLAEAVHAAGPAPVIAITGFARAAQQPRWIAAGAGACLNKLDPLARIASVFRDSASSGSHQATAVQGATT